MASYKNIIDRIGKIYSLGIDKFDTVTRLDRVGTNNPGMWALGSMFNVIVALPNYYSTLNDLFEGRYSKAAIHSGLTLLSILIASYAARRAFRALDNESFCNRASRS